MKTAQIIVNNLIDENIFPLKATLLRQYGWYLGIHFYVKTHISHTKSFNIPVSVALATLVHVKCVWDMSQYNKLANFQCTKFQILVIHIHFGLVPTFACQYIQPGIKL